MMKTTLRKIVINASDIFLSYLEGMITYFEDENVQKKRNKEIMM